MTTMAATAQQRRAEPEEPRGGGLPGAVAAEWTKLWGLRSTWFCLVGAVVATGGTALLAALALQAGGSAEGMTANALANMSIMLSQFAVVAVAALTVTGEYATGAMRTTLATTPQRGRMLAAKAAVLAGVAFAAGSLAGASAAAAAAAVFGDTMVWEASHVLHAVAGTAGHVSGVSLFTLGLGLLTRSTAGAITAAIGVLVAVPMISTMVGNETVTEIVGYLPAHAGVQLMSGTADPYGWGTGALLLAGWAALSLAAGFTVLSRRDA
ncbi:ABC transporter permease [Streptomonospora sediminis]